MPPSNTPNGSNPRSPASGDSAGSTPPPPLEPAHRPLTPLSYFSSPVPDLASTLHTSAAEDADEANVSFLRDSLESLDRAEETTASRGSTHRQGQSHNDLSRDPRIANRLAQARHLEAQNRSDSEDLSRRLRLQRVLARLNQIHDPTTNSTSSAAAYSNRTPSPGRNDQYDWAPSHETTTNAASQDENELDQILAELRRQPSSANSSSDAARLISQSESRTRERNRDSHAPSSTDLLDAAAGGDRQRRSLRSRAVLQRARQESSPSATERILRYAMERRGTEMSEEEERARAAGWFNPAPAAASNRTSGEQHRSGTSDRDSWPLPPSANELRSRTMQERAEAMQRRYGENAPPRLPRISTPPVPATATSSSNAQFLENALRYLDQLRFCYSYEQALSAAIDHGLATKEFFADKHDDFVMDLSEIEPVAGSSWLQPGTIFEGHQHATNGNAALLATRAGASSRAVEQINPNFRTQSAATGFDHPPGSTRWVEHPIAPFHSLAGLSGSSQPSSSMLLSSSKIADAAHDHWPVRVIIHSIDSDRMTLQGTMEAYDVPQHPHSLSITNSADRPKAGKKNAPITTYLEGHIIDLDTHSFLTPNTTKDPHRRNSPLTDPNNSTHYTHLSDSIAFPSANEKTDASNWRKLPPFNEYPSDEETARVLLSKDRMSDVGRDYIFMRWKERCFVHGKGDTCSESERQGDQDRGHGLTISGFYYVSLRRADGVVEGLYFDPTSTPYQCLRLKGRGSGWGAVELR
ncbi:hypothetical protein CBER1_10416 [Cercospora berteroae]|uniref:Vacuolar import and degradation protein-domain-containing protein n=1 Tax=Cercospora berteroae TaxID=357750 RepID=A0A2S6BY65_9PEZI|nr:hypothetical protein CBER1_10416 [Cercospora berteroae]